MAVTNPAVTDPAVTDPAVTDPAVTDPAVTDPAVTDPTVTANTTVPASPDPTAVAPPTVKETFIGGHSIDMDLLLRALVFGCLFFILAHNDTRKMLVNSSVLSSLKLKWRR